MRPYLLFFKLTGPINGLQLFNVFRIKVIFETDYSRGTAIEVFAGFILIKRNQNSVILIPALMGTIILTETPRQSLEEFVPIKYDLKSDARRSAALRVKFHWKLD